MCQDILDFRFRDIVIVDVRNAGRGINVVSNLHVVIMRPFSVTPNIASEGRRSAQHGGVPSSRWLYVMRGVFMERSFGLARSLTDSVQDT